MTFRAFLRAEGVAASITGIALLALGVVQGRQGQLDALVGGIVMLLMTGGFLTLVRGVAWRDVGGWFTSRTLAGSAPPSESRSAAGRGRLLARVVLDAVALAGLTLLLSHLTGYWLTYMDLGVWLVLTGLIRIGPARAAVARLESSAGVTYHVLSKPLTGPLRVVGTA